MVRTITTKAAALVLGGFALAGTVAGCSSATDSASADPAASDATSSASESATSTPAATTDAGAASTSPYTDGEYTATGSYQSPAGEESIDVDLTLEGGVVTAVTVDPQADDGTAVRYQTEFAEGIADEVVGVAIDDLSVDKVAGSSLTSDGFNAAVEQIKDDASA